MYFKIDRSNRTASLFKVNVFVEGTIIIPRTVEHESVEYLITSVSGISDNLKTLKFVEDSAVETIYGYLFPSISKINKICFPSSLKELKEGWCSYITNLTKITISPSNSQFMMREDKYLIGKSDPNKDEFDILLFGLRNIKEISIPSNIKILSSYAFESCEYLTKVEIPTNSNLQTIGKSAFSNTNIKEIFIPSKVSEICEYAFNYCQNLTKVEIPTNSNLQTIGESAFSNTNIKEIFIPSKVSKICEYAFNYCQNLTKVEIPTNSNLQTIGKSAFSNTNIKEIFIPSKVSKINECSFCFCQNLQIIEISEDSKLEIFPFSYFKGCSEVIIMIPTNIINSFNITKPENFK